MDDVSYLEERILSIANKKMALYQPDNATPIGLDDEFLVIGMDPMTFVEIMVEVEATFNIEIPNDKLYFESIGTVKRMCNFVSTKLAGLKSV